MPKPSPPPPPSPATIAGYLDAVPAARFNRNVVVLDPAHGGADSGATITDGVLEKDVDLALANRLRSLLAARGFTVVMTRDLDVATEPGNAAAPLSLDGRAAIANHAFAAACLLLHATAAGTGVHLYASELDPLPAQPLPTPWLTAQAAWSAQSQRLAGELGSALTRSHVPLVSSRASVRPVDSLTCPALVVELAPENADAASISGAAYQGRVAEAVAAALVFWPSHAQPPAWLVKHPPATPATAAGSGTPSVAPAKAAATTKATAPAKAAPAKPDTAKPAPAKPAPARPAPVKPLPIKPFLPTPAAPKPKPEAVPE